MVVRADCVKKTRCALRLTQDQLAQLLGVHVITVSKWERGRATPTAYQTALLDAFAQAAHRQADIGIHVAVYIATRGVAYALYILLATAYADLLASHINAE